MHLLHGDDGTLFYNSQGICQNDISCDFCASYFGLASFNSTLRPTGPRKQNLQRNEQISVGRRGAHTWWWSFYIQHKFGLIVFCFFIFWSNSQCLNFPPWTDHWKSVYSHNQINNENITHHRILSISHSPSLCLPVDPHHLKQISKKIDIGQSAAINF